MNTLKERYKVVRTYDQRIWIDSELDNLQKLIDKDYKVVHITKMDSYIEYILELLH